MIYNVLDSDVISEDEIFMNVLNNLVAPLWAWYGIWKKSQSGRKMPKKNAKHI